MDDDVIHAATGDKIMFAAGRDVDLPRKSSANAMRMRSVFVSKMRCECDAIAKFRKNANAMRNAIYP